MAVEQSSPAAIDAVPLRHPWRWVGAGVIVVLVGLVSYGAATDEAYGWSTYTEYLFNERILFGVLNTLQLTVYAMLLGVGLGIVLSVMRLSPNPVFQSVAWVFLWIFRGTPVYVQLVFWGLSPTIYQNIQIGVPFGPSLFHLNLQSLSIPFLLAVIGLGDTVRLAVTWPPHRTRVHKNQTASAANVRKSYHSKKVPKHAATATRVCGL